MKSTEFRHVCGIDPGNKMTAYALYDKGSAQRPFPLFGKIPNDEIFDVVQSISCSSGDSVIYGIEFPQPRGQLASRELFATVFWVGRLYSYMTEVVRIDRDRIIFVDRKDVKMHLCESSRANDSQIRQSLIDKFGGAEAIRGPKCPACSGRGGAGLGKKRVLCSTCGGSKLVEPGVLYGIAADVWQAGALSITCAEVETENKSPIK